MDQQNRNYEKIDGSEISIKGKSKFLSRLDNFWYHHKWKVLIIGFFAIFLIVGIVQMTTKTEADITVTVATHTIFYKENVAALEGDLTSLMPSDRNGDGKKVINLKPYKIYSESELKAANEAETDADGNPVIYADEAYNKEQIKQFNSFIGTGECSVMILSEYMYNDLVSRRTDVSLLIPMSEIYGDSVPAGVMSDGYGIRLKQTGAYDYFASLHTIPDDAVICIMRPHVFSNNSAQRNQFAIDYFLSIVSFGQ